MRVAIYIRLSEDTEITTSPARQRQICQQYIDQRGWTTVETFEDIDISATKTGLVRPGLTRLREFVKAGQADVVLVWCLDRLTRTGALDTLLLVKEFNDHGCAAASATEPFDFTTAIGKTMVTLIASFAEMEADATRERVRSSIDELRRDGRFAGGTVPYGYVPVPNPDGPGRALAIDPAEAAVIWEAADLVHDGHSLGYICRKLNGRKIPAPRSEARRLARSEKPTEGADISTWRVQSLRRLLTSDHLAGRVTHRGEVLRGDDGLPLEVWPAIIDGARLAHLREVLMPDGTPRPPRQRRARMLSGIARCAVCSARMYARNGGNNHLIYSCSTRQNGGECPSPRVSALALEKHVVDEVLKVIGDRPMTCTVPIDNGPANRGVSFQEVEQAISATTKALQSDDSDIPTLLARLALLKEKRAELREVSANPPVMFVIEETGESWAEAFDAVDDEGKRVLLEAEISAVRVRPTESRSKYLDTSRVTIDWTRDDDTEDPNEQVGDDSQTSGV